MEIMYVAPSNVIKFCKLKKGSKLSKLKTSHWYTECPFIRARDAEVNKTNFIIYLGY